MTQNYLANTIEKLRHILRLAAEQVAAQAKISKADLETLERGEWDKPLFVYMFIGGHIWNQE